MCELVAHSFFAVLGDKVAIRATVQKYSELSPWSSSGATSGTDLLLATQASACGPYTKGRCLMMSSLSLARSPCPTSPIVKAALLPFPIAQSYNSYKSIHQHCLTQDTGCKKLHWLLENIAICNVRQSWLQF
ncbi:hypothetical protein PGT21_006183 [Puccinia graminis f. sp. tritici]|uniref:Uncharacterized protein n=1 Tax=Puccinia graminis f. sp. tritici TaxID=56615 RepID=A0A5B0R4L9_PUCGR|nr:hypothetical protein PGT21_006183 [Puccinia graminis f. sp. tritici]KAA1120447.1 hypothetical protein PGTUg99_019849 [Puccinia graminis f. sp. tritici]